MAVDQELRALVDERAIQALIVKYCHTMDQGDAQGWLDCFTSDAVYEVLLPDGSLYARIEGEVALRQFIAGFPRPGLHKHIYAVPQIELDVDLGTATVDVYFFMLSQHADKVGVSAFGSSADRLVRTEAGWRFSERRIITEAMGPE